MSASRHLSEVSLLLSNYGNDDVLEIVLRDWFEFLGGKPGEVVVVDGGSDAATHEVYWRLFKAGEIDKLQLIRADHEENDKERCYVQEYTVANIACKPYLLWIKIDVFPFRCGHDDWLDQAVAHLDRSDVFAVGGAFNRRWEHHDGPWPGWKFVHQCTINFALMKRSTFQAALQEAAGEFIARGFRGEHPFAAEAPNLKRFLLEHSFGKYIERHHRYTLVKLDDPSWTVFHTNAKGPHLLETRARFRAREGLEKYANAFQCPDPTKFFYYGFPVERHRASIREELGMALGRTRAGQTWRKLKRRFL